MEDQNKQSLSKTILNFFLLVPSFFSIKNNLIQLIKSESQFAIQNLILIFILLILFASLLTISWACVIALLFTYFLSINLNMIASALIVFFLNILVLILLSFFAFSLKKNLSFPRLKNKLQKK